MFKLEYDVSLSRSVFLRLLGLVALTSCRADDSDSSTRVYRAEDGFAVASDDPLVDKPKQYLFAQIPWGSNFEATMLGMKKQGFVFVENDKDGDRIFRGRIAGEDTYAFASITPENRLVRIQLAVSPPENMFWQKYEIIKNSLVEKYGEPYKDDKKFDAPYKEGDGYEAQAIRSGKATYNSEWWTTYTKNPDGSGEASAIAGLTLYVKDQLIAYITYYSKSWPKEYDRRYKNGTGGL